MNKIGIQLYSYTFDCELDFLERIKTSGEIGFNLVEFAGGYENLTAAQVKKALEEAGVEALSSHVPLEKVEEQIEFLAEVGVKYIIVPYAPFATKEEARELANDLNDLGKKCSKYGMKMGYHNHTQEFHVDDGKYLLDWLIEYTDPNYVVFEFDCGWVTAAGVNAVEYINANKGRVKLIHIKENAGELGVTPPVSRHSTEPTPVIKRDANGNRILTEEELKQRNLRNSVNVAQGQGNVDWKAVKAAADAQSDEDIIYVVEREYSYNEPKERVVCLKEDCTWIKENL